MLSTQWVLNLKEQKMAKPKREKLSVYKFWQMFPDEEAAEKFFENERWGESGRSCPHCGSLRTVETKNRKPAPYRCKDCRKHFSIKSGSVMYKSKLTLHQWLYAMYLLSTSLKGVSSTKLGNELGIKQEHAWHLAHKIRTAMEQGNGFFTKPCEADETYIGGLEKNKHTNKRKHDGRGTKGKTAVLGIKERESKKVAVKVTTDTTGKTLSGFIGSHVEAGNTVYTDEHKGYNPIATEYNHKTVKHSVGQYVDGQIHTNGMESFWATLKRGYIGTYHRLSEKHLQKYADEFAYRHNARETDTIDQIKSVVKGMEGKRLTYRELTGNATTH